MNGDKVIFTMIFSLLWSMQVGAETLVEIRNTQGLKQQVFISDDYARMQVTQPQHTVTHYQLVDLKAHKIYMVNLAEKRYIDLSIMTPPQQPNMPSMYGQRAMPPVQAKLVKVEQEPIDIAGYPAQHYQMIANEQVCSDEYFSQSAAAIAQIASLDKTMQAIKETQPKPEMPPQHPCIQAQQILESQIQDLGMNMKSVYAQGQMAGKVRTEVVKIETDADVDEQLFSLQGLTALTQQEMQQMMRSGQQ